MAKGPQAFRTISEASDELDLPQHVLRFWETRFPFIKPLKRAGGRRFYRPQDIAVLATIKQLLHFEGYKIEGVQRLYREQGIRRFTGGEAVDEAPAEPHADSGRTGRLQAVLASLRQAKAELDAALGAA